LCVYYGAAELCSGMMYRYQVPAVFFRHLDKKINLLYVNKNIYKCILYRKLKNK
jgi:hypothetical protein